MKNNQNNKNQKNKNCSKNCGKNCGKNNDGHDYSHGGNNDWLTMKKSVKRIPAPTQRAIDLFEPPSNTDVNGSYTGKPKNKQELPVQDADDL